MVHNDMAPTPEALRIQEENRVLRTAVSFLQTFQAEVQESLPIQMATTFMIVATHENRSLKEYTDLAGVAQSTMSRHLSDLGDKRRTGELGHQLIERLQDPAELRRNMYRLTPKGRRLKEKLVSVLKKTID